MQLLMHNLLSTYFCNEAQNRNMILDFFSILLILCPRTIQEQTAGRYPEMFDTNHSRATVPTSQQMDNVHLHNSSR